MAPGENKYNTPALYHLDSSAHYTTFIMKEETSKI